MAELQTAAPAAKGTKPRAKKHAFRLDMTPMVDLAFLLLTFFMLTTTFSKPTVMEVAMPAKGKETSEVAASKALTLLLGPESRIQYFFGENPGRNAAALHSTTFGAEGLRKLLLQFRQKQGGMVLIKPTDEASYQNMVDALDEMNITDTKKYALVELDQADRTLLANNR